MTIAKAVVSAVLIVWILTRVDIQDVLRAMLKAHLNIIGLAFSLQFVGTFLTASRWKRLLAAQGLNIPLRFLMQSWIVGNFFKQFLPSTIGADAIRVYDSWRAGAGKSVALAVVGVDRLFGLLVLTLFALGAAFFTPQIIYSIPKIQFLILLVAMALFLSIAWIFMPPSQALRINNVVFKFLPRGLRWLADKISASVAAFRGKRAALATAFGISILLQLNVVTFYFLIGLSMNLEIPYHSFLLIVPVAIFIMLVPVSINAIGIRENAFVFLLGAFGVSNADAVAYAWIEFGLFLVFGLVGGILYAFRK